MDAKVRRFNTYMKTTEYDVYMFWGFLLFVLIFAQVFKRDKDIKTQAKKETGV